MQKTLLTLTPAVKTGNILQVCPHCDNNYKCSGLLKITLRLDNSPEGLTELTGGWYGLL
jgi:hypothetical protein